MKFLPLIWAGVWRRPGRAILTLLSVINAFVMFGVLQGFVGGMNKTVEDMHADVLITASRISQVEPLPMSQLPLIRSAPGVAAVTPVVIFQGNLGNVQSSLRAFGVDPDAFQQASPASHVPPALIAALKASRNGAIVPKVLADQFGWKVGSRIPFNVPFWTNREGTHAWPLDVVGVYDSTGADFLFSTAILVNYDFVDQGRTTANGTTSIFLVRVTDPNRASEVSAAVDAQFANSPHETKTVSERQMAADSMKQVGDIGFVVTAVLGAVFFALLFSVGAVMMQSVRERTPELAVLKTLGFTDMGVLAVILSECLVFCLIGAAIGLGLTAALFPLVTKFIGFEISAGPVLLMGFVVAGGLALVTGLPPAIRGMRLQIVDALAGR